MLGKITQFKYSNKCADEQALFVNSLNASSVSDMGLSIRASQSLYACARQSVGK
jgi:hypothetical protein